MRVRSAPDARQGADDGIDESRLVAARLRVDAGRRLRRFRRRRLFVGGGRLVGRRLPGAFLDEDFVRGGRLVFSGSRRGIRRLVGRRLAGRLTVRGGGALRAQAGEFRAQLGKFVVANFQQGSWSATVASSRSMRSASAARFASTGGSSPAGPPW
ncbi:MAG: hypothetical protein U5K76_07680 [Woeseiaceae bacterium]|nr:hypothetical protein [Woeseiaceae bacterium]